MNAVARQRRIDARRIAQATAATAAAVVLSGGVAHASAPTDLRSRPSAARTDTTGRTDSAGRDRVDAVSGVPTSVDLLAGDLPTDRALVALTATPDHGRVVLHEDATATYASVPGYTGGDSFSYRFTDDRGRTSRVTVAVTVIHGTTPATAYAVSAHAA